MSPTSMDRVLAALGHTAPDRTPVLLTVTMHGARLLGTTIEDYFSRAENVVEGQLRLRERLGHDCLLPFFNSAVEAEAYGCDTIYSLDGPANAGRPILRGAADIEALDRPGVDHPRLTEQLRATRGLARAARGEVPVLGAVISGFSIPIMLMGFERYLTLMHEEPDAHRRLLEITGDFALAWGRAQLEAGATALAYFDPLAGVDMVTESLFVDLGLPLATRFVEEVGGPVAYHLASARTGERLELLSGTGAVAVSLSHRESLVDARRAAAGRVAVLGNLNGVAMARWSPTQAAEAAEQAIVAAGTGGGFLLADNHGEIPYQVPLDVLRAVVDAAKRTGSHPDPQPGEHP